MSAVIISDTSCLIALEQIDHLYILHDIFGQILTTPEIEEEFGRILPNWIQVRKYHNQNKRRELELRVDKGEASAIALALETRDCLLIIDEKKGRQLATKLQIQIIGTLKVILMAKRKGVIPAVKPLIIQLLRKNFRISPEIVNGLIVQAGEE